MRSYVIGLAIVLSGACTGYEEIGEPAVTRHVPLRLHRAPEGAAVQRCRALARPPEDIAALVVPDTDVEALQREDALQLSATSVPRYAAPHTTALRPDQGGTWRWEGDQLVWQLRVQSRGARSLNFGFSRYRLPAGAELWVSSADCATVVGPFTDRNNAAHEQLWTPMVEGEEAVLTLVVPPAVLPSLELELGSVNRGYVAMSQAKSGSCNVDVRCREGNDWKDEIRAVAVFSTGGSLFCTGYLVNNAAADGTPYFMTANHCGINSSNAASLVVYWNYETSSCGARPDGRLDQFQSGAEFLVGGAASDFTLLRLEESPDPEFFVHYAGWDASDVAPRAAVAIHHPNTDEKRISFENDPLTITEGFRNVEVAGATHLRIGDWDVGTTEPGSSGSPLFNAEHRIIGQLHGGQAACGNSDPDWYGRFAISYRAGLSRFLDPQGSGATAIDGRDACDAPQVAISITPSPAEVGEPVTFASSVSGGQPPYTYAWDVDGDGATDASDAGFEFVYQRRFDDTVKLKVTDAAGCAGAARQQLAVGRPPQYLVDNRHRFEAIDISSGGTALDLDDDGATTIQLPFAFRFYDLPQSSVTISTNGVVTFRPLDSMDYDNKPIPSANGSGAESLIAVFWDDLKPGQGAPVFYKVEGQAPQRRLIVQWNKVRHYSASNETGTFQLILHEQGGLIVMQYLDVTIGSSDVRGGRSATVGIQESVTSGVQYSYNEAVLTDRTAISFRPQAAAAIMSQATAER